MNKQSLYLLLLICLSLTACGTAENDILYQDDKGNTLRMSDLENLSPASVRENREMMQQAVKLQQEARRFIKQTRFDDAIKMLKASNQIEPTWAQPLYDIAYASVQKGDFITALDYYKQVDKLEPKGFFTSKTAIWALEKENIGVFHEGMYKTYLRLGKLTAEEQQGLVANILEEYPNYAPAWVNYAGHLKDKKERLAALEKGLASDPDIETKGVLLVNKAFAMSQLGEKDAAIKILGQLMFDENTSKTNQEMARSVIARIVNIEATKN